MFRRRPPGPVTLTVLLLLVLGASPAFAHGRPKPPKPPAPPALTVLGHVAVGRHPQGVAVHAGRAQAVVANRGSRTISVVDLLGESVVATVRVGRHPRQVAVNPRTNVALVTLGEERAVALVDLDTLAVVRKIRVGRRPEGVAVDPALDVAVVANSGERSVSVLDLAAGRVTARLLVGHRPTGVAVNPLTHTFAVTNERDGTVTLLDLGDPAHPTSPGTLSLPGSELHWKAGRHRRRGPRARPRGIAFDYGAGLNRLLVADPGARAVHVLTLTAANELAALASLGVSWKPEAVAVSPGFDFGLVTGGHDDVRALALAPPRIVGHADVRRRPRGVAIDPVTCRAAVTTAGARGVSILDVPCDRPRLVALSPASVLVDAAFTLTLTGAGFGPDTTVSFGSQTGLVPAARTPTSLTLALTAPATPGSVPVSVTSNGQTSNALALQVKPILPVVTSLTPATAPANGDNLLLEVQGAFFSPGATVLVGGAPLAPLATVGCEPPACLAVLVPGYPGSTLTLAGGALPVQVRNADGALSGVVTLTLQNPVPLLDEISPSVVAAGAGDTVLDLFGLGFVAIPDGAGGLTLRSQVLVNGAPVEAVADPDAPTVHLTATIPAAALQTPGALAITVLSPGPGGGASAARAFTVQGGTLPPGITVATLAIPEDAPRNPVVFRQGARVLGAVALRDAGAIRILDLTDPTRPALVALIQLVDPLPPPEGRFDLVDGLAVHPGTQTLVAALSTLDQVAIVDVSDLGNPSVVTVDLPAASFPHGVAVDPGGNRAVVTNLGIFDDPLDGTYATLTVIDLGSSAQTTVRLPGAQTPERVAVNTTTGVAVVTDQTEDGGALWLVDLAAAPPTVQGPFTFVTDPPTGVRAEGPFSLAVDPTRNRAVVASEGDAVILVVTLASGAVLGPPLAAGAQPSGVALDPATGRALVVNVGNNEITVVNTASPAVVTRLVGLPGAQDLLGIAWLPDAVAADGVPGVALIGSDSAQSVTVLGIPAGALP